MATLAVADRSATARNTNASRSISFSILDRDGNEVEIQTHRDHPIEIIIPRDPNLPIPLMILQNVTSLSVIPHAQTHNLHFVNLSALTSSFSLHLRLHPLNSNLSYLLIYKFDQAPRLNSSISDIDGWSLFCNSTLHTFFLNNDATAGHRSIIFGVRQLNTTEADRLCLNQSIGVDPPRSDQPFRFTDNYELQVYTSGCFYLDAEQRWRSDGLTVTYPPPFPHASIRSLAGGSVDRSIANALPVDPSHNLRWRLPGTAETRELELRIRQC